MESFSVLVRQLMIMRKTTQTAMNGIIKDIEAIWHMALLDIE